MTAELILLMALNINKISLTIEQNTNDCPVVNGVVRCDLKEKEKRCRYVNGYYVCE